MFIAIASSSLPLLPTRQAEQPDIIPLSGLSLWCWDLCLDEHFSWKSPSPAVTQRMRGHLECHRGVAVWSQPCQQHGCKVKPPIFPLALPRRLFSINQPPSFPTPLDSGEALQTNRWTWRSSSDQPLDLEKLFRLFLGPGEALQTNPWTSPCFLQQPPGTSLPANGSHARKELPSPSRSPRTWLMGSISFSQEVQDATRARVSPLLSSHHKRSVCPVGKSRPKTRW